MGKSARLPISPLLREWSRQDSNLHTSELVHGLQPITHINRPAPNDWSLLWDTDKLAYPDFKFTGVEPAPPEDEIPRRSTS